MLKDFNAVKITIASPQDILNNSFGEVTKAETINYRTFKSEPGGLMAEEIFGPTKDYECYCGKYKKIRYKGIICDRCGVEVTHKRVRRERMGHIKLAAPVTHVWFAHGVPNRLSLILDIPQKKLETVVYYARYVVTSVNEEEKKLAIEQIPTIKQEESVEIEEELAERIAEIEEMYQERYAKAKKEEKDAKKQAMIIEKIKNDEKEEIAKIKSAFNARKENLDKKFDDLQTLVESIIERSTLSEEEFQLLDEYDANFFEAGMGAEAIKVLLDNLDLDREIESLKEEKATTRSQLKKARAVQRLRVLSGLQNAEISPAWVILTVLPVTPPDLRPIIQLAGGRFATYDLNDLYRRVINRNNRLKRLISLGAPEIILRNEKRMLQEAVDSLLDNQHKPGAPALNSRKMPFKSLSDVLRGKQGRFRQNLLGKRVDYSGRAVIIPGPELKFDECGLPKVIALELFKPFIIRELISRGLAANPTKAKSIFESKSDDVWDILDDVIKDRPVILNRAPTLHKQSMLAFYPVLIEGNAIRLHPMTCKGFNADFDGDQMAVHLPLSEKAVAEVKSRMFAKDNMLSSRDGKPIVNVEKDMAMGIYFLTIMKGTDKDAKHFFENEQKLLSAYDLGEIRFFEPIKVLLDGKLVTTTVGRVIFNKVLPEGYEFVNTVLNSKDIAQISAKLFRDYGRDVAIASLDKIKALGFEYSTKSGFSISMTGFDVGADKFITEALENYHKAEDGLVEKFYEGFMTEKGLETERLKAWMDASDEIQSKIWTIAQDYYKEDHEINMVDLDNSGATPVKAWLKKISGVSGYVTDMFGSIINYPIVNNYKHGLNNFEYFVAAKSVRKSMTDVSLKTAESGYLSRRLVDVAQDIITKDLDCETTEGLYIERATKRQQSYGDRLLGRYLAEDLVNPKNGELLAKANSPVQLELSKLIDATPEITKVKVRSPLTCSIAHGVCTKCYGFDNATGKTIDIGEAAGVIAAQALGEPTTQLTLKSKSDARAAKSDVTQGLPRVEELFEARTPKALSILSEIDGTVKIIEDKKKIIIRVSQHKKTTESYDLKEGDEVIVKNGEFVKKNEPFVVRADKSEIVAEFPGIVNIKGNIVELHIDTEIESERSTAQLTDLMVKEGDVVSKGDQLTYGSIDPKEYAQLKGLHEAQQYVVSGIQEVYGLQGLEVDDRHLEIIARQMGRYCLIKDNGGSDEYLPGDYVDYLDLLEENRKLESEGKKPIAFDRVLVGITRSAILTESFLSAASFEQQIRVLTDAALVGKVDYLRGLKENVIIGKPVPLGNELKRKLGMLPAEEEVEETSSEEDEYSK